MPKAKEKEELLKEIDDLKNLMSHLEDEYGKANVSEKSYQELREKYSEQILKLEKKAGIKKENAKKKAVKEKTPKKEEEPEEEVEEEEEAEESEKTEETEKPKEPEAVVKEEPTEGGKLKIGFFSKLLKKSEKPKEEAVAGKSEAGKKEEKPKKDEIEVGEVEEMTPEVIEKLAQQVAEQSGVSGDQVSSGEMQEAKTEPETSGDIEIEKLKVMIEGIREANRTTEETIRNLSESIGEIRSMVFQADGSLKETSLKLEKIETDISEVKPKEIEKKFREIGSSIENFQMQFEKMGKKSEDLADKIYKVYEILKAIGGIENLINLNKDVQTKAADIKEALSYTERLSSKTEKIFIDLTRSLDEFAVYKSKQDGLDEAVRDVLKAMDGVNVKFDNYVSKKDLEGISSDISVIHKQIEEINKMMPVVLTKLPEVIEKLKKEKEGIQMFLEFSEQQVKSGAISRGDYDLAKQKNLQRLDEIEKQLEKEWEDFKNIGSKSSVQSESATPIKSEAVPQQSEPSQSGQNQSKELPSVSETSNQENESKPEISGEKPEETEQGQQVQPIQNKENQIPTAVDIKSEQTGTEKPKEPEAVVKEEPKIENATNYTPQEAEAIKKFNELLQNNAQQKEPAWKKLKGFFRSKS
jgi:hypothetical protein